MINADVLDRRIAICRPSTVDDGMASVPGKLIEIGQRWAKKTDVRDGERLHAGENAANLASRFVVRSDALTRTIGGKDVIRYRGRDYYVVGVKDVGGRDDGIEITTSSRVDQP